MIRYYLVNPKAVSAVTIRQLPGHFGISSKRLIAVPKREQWFKEILKYAEKNLKPYELTEFIERLNKLVNDSLVEYALQIPEPSTWTNQANTFAEIVQAVISFRDDEVTRFLSQQDKFIAIEDFPPISHNSWNAPLPTYYPTKPEQFASLLEPFFRISTGDNLYIIDPHFDVANKRFIDRGQNSYYEPYWESLKSILQSASRYMKLLKRVEVHIGAPLPHLDLNNTTAEQRREMLRIATQQRISEIRNGWEAKKQLIREINPNLEFICCHWNHNVLHERYVLTKHGGLEFGAGLMYRRDNNEIPQNASVNARDREEAGDIIAYYYPREYNIEDVVNDAGRLPKGTTVRDLRDIIVCGSLPPVYQGAIRQNKVFYLQ